LYYTASGIITTIGGRPVHRCTGRPPAEHRYSELPTISLTN